MSKDKNKNIELAEAKAQISGELINQTNSKRQKMLQGAVRKIDDDHLIKSEQREACFMEALSAMDQAKEFCNNPNNVLGSTKTKHGEVAERIEEALLNAEASFNGEEPIATASPDIVGRTINAPADIMINGIPVQLKYCKTELASIYNVNKHLKKYPDFGSKDGAYYIIPKDQYELISAMYNKTIDELTNHEKTVLNWVYKIENQTNRKFGDIIRSGKTTYAEVQLDIANDTINSKINTLDKEKKDQLKELEREKNANKKNAEKKYASSAKEAIKVAGISAVMGAGMTLALILFQKWDEGTSISDLSEDDWIEIGKCVGYQFVRSGITGASIYELTNHLKLRSDFASAAVSATIGVGELLVAYRKHRISGNEFMAEAQILCFGIALSTIGGILGNAIIPNKVLGTAVGSIAMNIVWDIVQKGCEEEVELIPNIMEYINADRIDDDTVLQLVEKYNSNGRLMGVLKQYGELASYGDYLNLLNTNRAKSAIKDVDNILIGLRTNGEEESSRVMGKYLKDNAVESDFVDEEHFLEVMENQDMIYF